MRGEAPLALFGLRLKGRSRPFPSYFTVIGQDRIQHSDNLFPADFADLLQRISARQKARFYRRLMASLRDRAPVEFHVELSRPGMHETRAVTAVLQPGNAEGDQAEWHGVLSVLEPQGTYQKVFETSPDKIAIFDDGAHFIRINQNLAASLELDSGRVFGRRAGQVLKSGHGQLLDQAIQNVALSRKETFVELPIEKADGTTSVQVVKLVPHEDETTGRCQVIAFGHTVDDLAKLKAAAEHSQDQLHAAIRTLPDLFWVKDLDGRYTLCNDVFDEFNRVPPGAMLGKTAYDTTDRVNKTT